MKQRVTTAIILIPILGLCMALSLITRVLLLAAAAALCCREMRDVFGKLGIRIVSWCLYLYVAGHTALVLLRMDTVFLTAWFFLMVFLVFFAAIAKKDIGAKGAMATLSALIYPFMLLAAVIWMGTNALWIPIFTLAVLSSWVCDSFAMFGGKLFGRHKLAPEISPKKTVEGCLSGAVGGALTGLILYYILVPYFALPLWLCVATALAASSFGQVGDLAASLLKRMAGIKDYSNLIPGHGGMLDRMDSLLFSIPVAYFCLYIAGYIV